MVESDIDWLINKLEEQRKEIEELNKALDIYVEEDIK
jgi:hypothetical protein